MRDSAVLLRLLAFLRPFTKQVALSTLLGLLTVAAGVGLMATSAYLISAAALRPSIAELQVAIVGVRFFGLSRGIFRYLERLVTHSANLRLLASLRTWFYRQVEPLAPAGLVYERGGDLLSRAVADVDNLENFYVRAVSPPVVAAGTAAAMAFFLGQFDARLALALLAFLLLAGVGLPWLSRVLSRRTGQAVVEVQGQIQAEMVEMLEGLPEITAFGLQAEVLERLEGLEDVYARLQQRMARISGVNSAMSGLAHNLGLWSVAAVGVPLVAAGAMRGVDLAVVTLAAMASFEAVAPLSSAAQHLDSSLQSARRLLEIASREAAVKDPEEPAPEPAGFGLDIRGLTFRYNPSESPALEGLDLRLEMGRRAAVVGASGAGKSSLASLLARFWEPQAGEIRLGGRDLRAYAAADVRRWVTLISQSTYLYDATLRRNLLLARPDAAEDDLWEALRLAQIEDFARGLPDGLDTWVGERGLRLSGGERQRVALARALLRRSPVLVLDEPTTGLDPATARRFMAQLLDATNESSLLLITHRLEGLECMDEIVVLREGRVVERGTLAELLAQNGWLRRMRDLGQSSLA